MTERRDKRPRSRSDVANVVIRTLVLSAKLFTRRVTAMERILPPIIISVRTTRKQVRRATRTGDRPEESVGTSAILSVIRAVHIRVL